MRPHKARTTMAPRIASGRSCPTGVTRSSTTTMTAAPMSPVSCNLAPLRVAERRAGEPAADDDTAERPGADVGETEGDQLLVGVDLVPVR